MLTSEEFIEMLHERGITSDEVYQDMKDEMKEESHCKDEEFRKMIEELRGEGDE